MTTSRNYRFITLGIFVFLIAVTGNKLLDRSTQPNANPVSHAANQSLELPSKASPFALPSISPLSTPTSKIAVYARSYIVIDEDTKYPLIAKDPDTPVAIASITKVMTFLTAYDAYEMDHVVTVPREAATIPGSEIQLLTGETVTVKNLLYALLINSANDAAYALAADDSGSPESFVQRMNEKAVALGLRNTHFIDPAGLDDTGRSTPRDIALLTAYALNNDLFRTIISIPEYTIWSADNRYKHDLVNSNRLVKPDEPLYYPNALGGKTGFTFDAGHCLVTAADGGGTRRYIAVVLHTNEESKEASAREVRKLLVWANQNQ